MGHGDPAMHCLSCSPDVQGIGDHELDVFERIVNAFLGTSLHRLCRSGLDA